MVQYLCGDIKMNSILVVNHFLKGEKFEKLHSTLVSAAKSAGINLTVKTNLELAYQEIDCDFVLFWDKDVNLAKRLEKQGLKVFNSADSIAKCDDKARTYIELKDYVKQPETFIAPKCYFKSDMSEFVKNAGEKLTYPLVFKECFGSFGEQVRLCNNFDEVMALVTDKPFILQKFVKESCGKDKRIEIIGDKFVAAARRTNANDFRSNVTNGGTMTPCSASDYEIETAIKACKILGVTFGGVDVLDDGSVCEVNSNAHIINISKAINKDISPLIFKAIEEKLVDNRTE